MFFATSQPAVRRSAYAPAMRSLDRFLDQALAAPAASANWDAPPYRPTSSHGRCRWTCPA